MIKQLLPMSSEEELRTEYDDAGDRVWHLVPEGGNEKSLCGVEPGSDGWISVGLIPTCPECIKLQEVGKTGEYKAYHTPTGKADNTTKGSNSNLSRKYLNLMKF